VVSGCANAAMDAANTIAITRHPVIAMERII
jgi:hypothetical protein